MTFSGRPTIASSLLVLFFAASAPSRAFVLDSHYYVTFTLSLGTCFEWDEAQLIASGNFMLDRNKTTKAEINPRQQSSKRRWHAFGHDQARLNALWRRALEEPDPQLRLVKFGQFLHFLQDWESHARYPLTIGHAIASALGRDPDSLARDLDRSNRMLQSTLDHLGKMCTAIERDLVKVSDADYALAEIYITTQLEDVLVEVISNSDPGWRSRIRGKITKKGRRIVEENRNFLEHFIERRLADDPARKIPDDFHPGDPDRGIPDSLVFRLDVDGDLMNSIAEARSEELAEEDDDEENFERWVKVKDLKEIEKGVRVELVIKNRHHRTSPRGELTLYAVDVPTEEVLAEASATIPSLKPGRKVERTFELVSERQSSEVLVGLRIDLQDSSDLENELWLTTPQDYKELVAEIEAGVRTEYGSAELEEVKAIEFVEDPKTWFASNGLLCVLTEARTDLRDPTEELVLPEVFLVRQDGSTPRLDARIEGVVWSISAQLMGDRAGASTFDCYDPRTTICQLPDVEDYEPQLDVSIRSGDLVERRRVPVSEAVLARLDEVCAAALSEQKVLR